MEHAYIVKNRWALGDSVCLSALVRDIQLAHPGKYRISVQGNFASFWNHNPYVQPIDPKIKAITLRLEYQPGIVASTHGRFKGHFLTWFHKDFERLTKIKVPVTAPKGDIHLSAAEDQTPVQGRYWIVIVGGKLDMTAKWWHYKNYQHVVNVLAKQGIRCVQVGANFSNNAHTRLANCVDMVDKTHDIRKLFGLIKHSDGVICGITGAMHIAAVFDKPCVVVAGGREEPHWESYSNDGQWPAGCARVKTPHRFLHTIGMLDCCKTFGCWKCRVVPIERSDTATKRGQARLCRQPVRDDVQPVGKCMTLITPEAVVDAVLSYGQPEEQPTPPEIVESNVVPNVPKEYAPKGGFEDAGFKVLDNPYLGGRITIFVLCYGNYPDLARKCLNSIIDTVPASRREVRVALNQPCPETERFVGELAAHGIVSKIYPDHGSRRKYPAMRTMFRDPAAPITTKYLVWFDDDTMCIDVKWLVRLGEMIAVNHKAGCRLYGAKWVHDLAPYAKNGHNPRKWFEAAPWWRGKHLGLKGRPEQTAPNGSICSFVSGWFWAMATEMIAVADIPDARLMHNGGDICIGEQIHQAGFKIKEFNPKKSYIWTPTREQGGRRGHADPRFLWVAT